MALNSIFLYYNKILEVEECEPISSPSSTSFEEHKTVPDLNQINSPIHKTYNFPLELSNKKNKSSPPSFNSHNFYKIFFEDNNDEYNSIFSQKDITNFSNLNIEQENNNINNKNDIKNNNTLEKSSFTINKLYSSHSNKNPFQKANNFDSIEESNNNDKISKNNLIKNHRETDITNNTKLYKINNNCITNPKICPIKEDKYIDSFMEEINNIENKIKSINTDEQNCSTYKREIPKIKSKINEVTKISLPSLNYRNSNPNPSIKNKIYCKKKILHSNKILIKKEKMKNIH